MEISEQEFKYTKNSKDLLKELFNKSNNEVKDKSVLDEEIILKYYGEKDEEILQEIINEKEKKSQSFVAALKYGDFYIGSVSLGDLMLRAGFGLNKYKSLNNDFNSYYLGHWKNNMKTGLGFLKVEKSLKYIGNFTLNQFDEFGILFYPQKGNFFFGNFYMGEFYEGIYFNKEKKIIYKGKFENGKKSDKLGCFIDFINNKIFLGEVKDNNFLKGYIESFSLTEKKIENEGTNQQNNSKIINLSLCEEKLFYFNNKDKTNSQGIEFITSLIFDNEFYSSINNIINKFIMLGHSALDLADYFLELFIEIEKDAEDKENNINLDKYSLSSKDSFFLENSFNNKYQQYYKFYEEVIQSANDIGDIREKIASPVIKENLMSLI